MEPVTLTLHFFGSNVTEETCAEAGEHFKALLREITRVQCGDPDAIDWRLGPIRFICDGCDRERPDATLPLGWINAQGCDYCPECLFGGW